jgi:L-rhamnose mutarotase
MTRATLGTIRCAAAAMLLIAAAARGDEPAAPAVQRYGSIIGVRAEKLDYYKKLHAAVWPAVAKSITDCHIRNYSIYLRKMPDGNYYLFSYFEYTGRDFAGDMAKMKDNPEVQRWWKETDPCQKPLPDRKKGEWWAAAEEVFHQD